MGIIIIPLLFASLLVAAFAAIKTIKLLIIKHIALREIFLGLFVTLTLFGVIVLSYIIEGRAWGLSPAFRLPICMVFIPFGIYLLTQVSKNMRIKYASNVLLISIAISGILGIVFNDVFMNLLDYIGIEKHY